MQPSTTPPSDPRTPFSDPRILRLSRAISTFGLLGVLAIASAGCSSSLPDITQAKKDGSLNDSDEDAVLALCTGKKDGSACGSDGGGGICLAAYCVTSTCGDGFLDVAAGEECETKEDTESCIRCRWACSENAMCDDSNSCNGAEICNLDEHRCEAGILPLGSSESPAECIRPDGQKGVCNGNSCVNAGCGNGIVEGDEACDDKNTTSGDGCEPNCTWTCRDNNDCDDHNRCTGTETCDHPRTAQSRCRPGVALTCSSEKCAGTCNPDTGQCKFPDQDSDGASCDIDCIDTDPSVFPGAPECSDGKDNDCDTRTADGKDGSCLCYADRDNDGFAPAGTSPIAVVPCPENHTSTAPEAGKRDCNDSRADVFPGQSKWFRSGYCSGLKFCINPNWDYNCSGNNEKRYTVKASGCRPATILGRSLCLGSGWSSSEIPECGVEKNYEICSRVGSFCLSHVSMRRQECH